MDNLTKVCMGASCLNCKWLADYTGREGVCYAPTPKWLLSTAAKIDLENETFVRGICECYEKE